MRCKTIVLSLGMALGLAACSGADITSRNAPFEEIPPAGVSAAGQESDATAINSTTFELGKSPVSVEAVSVRVPETLRVSEANLYLPSGDIVWR